MHQSSVCVVGNQSIGHRVDMDLDFNTHSRRRRSLNVQRVVVTIHYLILK